MLSERADLVRGAAKELGVVCRPIHGLSHLPIAYRRSGALDDRLSIWPQLRDAVSRPASIVIDPDSRLTQLGLLPICPRGRLLLLREPLLRRRRAMSRYRCTGRCSWAAETFGVRNDPALIFAPARRSRNSPPRSASASARILRSASADPSKPSYAAATPAADSHRQRRGRRRSRARGARALRKPGRGIAMWDGSFAGFAEHIARSRLVRWLRFCRRACRRGLRRSADQHFRRLRFRANASALAPAGPRQTRADDRPRRTMLQAALAILSAARVYGFLALLFSGGLSLV